MRGIAVVAVTSAMVSIAQAQPPTPSYYSQTGKDYSMEIRLSKNGRTIMADVEMVHGQCTGGIDGPVPVKVVGRTLVLKKEPPNDDFPISGTCVLKISFDKNYTRASIRENNCRGWHGAGCVFDTVGLRHQKPWKLDRVVR